MKPQSPVLLESKEIKRMMKLGNLQGHTKLFLREQEEKKCKDCKCSPCECKPKESASECKECNCSPCECEPVDENLSVSKGTFPSQSKGSASAGKHGVPGAKSATKLPMGNNDGKMKPLATSTKNTGKGGSSPLSNLAGKKPSATGKDLSEGRKSKYAHLPDNEYSRLLREVEELERQEEEELPPDPNQEMPDFEDDVPEEMPTEEPVSVGGGDKEKFVEFMNKLAAAASEVFGIPVEVSSDGSEGEEDLSAEMPEEMPEMDQEMPEEMPEFEEEEESHQEGVKPVQTSAGKQTQLEGKRRRALIHSITMDVLQELKKSKKKSSVKK